MLYTKHKTNITNLTQIYPRKTQTMNNLPPSPTLKQHIVLNVTPSQDSKQLDQSIKLDKCVKSKEGDRNRKLPKSWRERSRVE